MVSGVQEHYRVVREGNVQRPGLVYVPVVLRLVTLSDLAHSLLCDVVGGGKVAYQTDFNVLPENHGVYLVADELDIHKDV